MTENERLILSELSRESPLSKRDITQRCGMGWATAVKLMTRLEEQGYIVPFGNERQNQAGKTATVYVLSAVKPAAIGIDIEYARARLTIRNLSGECLFESVCATPPLHDPGELQAFLAVLLDEAITKTTKLRLALEGIGIGVPSHLFGNTGVPYQDIATALSQQVGMPVTMDNNIRCFTAAVVSQDSAPRSLLVLTIRSGIGVGIVLDGHIYQGERGSSGEIGHFPVNPDGARCRCGKSGCLETIVNREALAGDLAAAKRGDAEAQARLEYAALLLGRAIASMMLVLDVRNVAIYAELGAQGQDLIEPIRRAAGAAVYPGFEFDIRYETLDSEAYVAGAARLVLNEFVRSPKKMVGSLA